MGRWLAFYHGIRIPQNYWLFVRLWFGSIHILQLACSVDISPCCFTDVQANRSYFGYALTIHSYNCGNWHFKTYLGLDRLWKPCFWHNLMLFGLVIILIFLKKDVHEKDDQKASSLLLLRFCILILLLLFKSDYNAKRINAEILIQCHIAILKRLVVFIGLFVNKRHWSYFF